MDLKFLWMIVVGLVTGVCSGLFGIGGGVVIVPILVFALGFSQHAASGTSLVALLLPVGLLGAIEYYRAGQINSEHVKYGLFLAVGLFFGAFLGAKVAGLMPEALLKRAFAVFLFLVAARLWMSARG